MQSASVDWSGDDGPVLQVLVGGLQLERRPWFRSGLTGRWVGRWIRAEWVSKKKVFHQVSFSGTEKESTGGIPS